jgi:diguanylate cyclase (GGDEF)-like protein
MTKQTILLMQSAQTQGNGTKRHLEERGYRVIWAGTGLTAFITARNEAIDLILLDVALPDIEGLDLCHRFRVRQDTRSIPIILLTSRGYTPERTAGKSYGPDGYLEKPYTESELEERIAEVLHKGAAATEQATEPLPGPEQTTEPQRGPGSSGEPATLREPRPALITLMQQVPKPDLKLVPKAEPGPRLPFDLAAALKRERKPEGDGERRPIVKSAPRPDLKPVPKGETGAPGKPEPAPAQANGPHGKSEQGPEIPHGPASNPEPPAEPKPDRPPSSILSFRGTGDAVVDPATGLFGRPQFEAMFSKEFKRAMRFKQQMSCMLINLDGQKMGRRADEALVKAIIGLVQKTIREVDTAAWWSGEAFIVLLPNTTRHDALQAAARVLEAVANHQFTWPDATNVTVSIGVAGLPDENIDSEQKLIEVADATCRRAQEMMVPPPFDVRSIRR